jgi:hypothetical protein
LEKGGELTRAGRRRRVLFIAETTARRLRPARVTNIPISYRFESAGGECERKENEQRGLVIEATIKQLASTRLWRQSNPNILFGRRFLPLVHIDNEQRWRRREIRLGCVQNATRDTGTGAWSFKDPPTYIFICCRFDSVGGEHEREENLRGLFAADVCSSSQTRQRRWGLQ